MMHPGRRIAFYAPMKAPTHPTPSGDRQIARLTLAALARAGFSTDLVSELRTLDTRGDPDVQAAMTDTAKAETAALIEKLRPDPPMLWFTYHCHYKAPDLIGPTVARALNIPYLLSEPSLSIKRRKGPWARFAEASEIAISAADRLLWTTQRDRPALEAAGHGERMVHLPAFVDPGPRRSARTSGAQDELALLTVAMMRPGDKLESYRRLAAALHEFDTPWTLSIIGDGAARAEVEALFAKASDRVRFLGAIDDPTAIRRACELADLFVWPGVGEGVGMVYLEAQAAGLPVVAEDHPAQRDLVATPLAPPDDPAAFAALIRRIADDKDAGHRARAHVEAHHSLDAAANTLRRTIDAVMT